ncbi:MAG: glycosyltransferase family protein [Rhodothermales bacterium]
MRVLFCIQGEGRGHMTQAIALAEWLRDAGHEVVAALVGNADGRTPPRFLSDALACPVEAHASPVIKLDRDSRSLDVWKTTTFALRRLWTYRRSVAHLEERIAAWHPDVVVNFYEPLLGLARHVRVPIVAIAHQYMFHHPRYPFAEGTWFQRRSMLTFTRLTSATATRLLALSLYPGEDLPGHNLRVVPPLLRKELFALTPRRVEPDYLLVYLWRPELLPEIREWCDDWPRFRVHCFLEHPEKAKDDPIRPNLTLHHLDADRFLQMMATCSGVATTAGFETTAEAMYLGKPLLMVPTHIEQQCNARDAADMGAAIACPSFDLERLEHITPSDQTAFRAWVASASEVFIQELEQVAGLPTRPDPGKRPQSRAVGVQKFAPVAS